MNILNVSIYMDRVDYNNNWMLYISLKIYRFKIIWLTEEYINKKKTAMHNLSF